MRFLAVKVCCCVVLVAGLVRPCDAQEVQVQNRQRRLAIIMAEDEYQAERTLPRFARQHLERDFTVHLVFANPEDRNDLPEIDILGRSDVALMAIRRRVLPVEQMAVIKSFLTAGKPLVAVRTTSHAFALRDGSPPQGYVDWPEFDREVLGGNYQGHHGNSRPGDPKTYVWALPQAETHPIMRGVPDGEFTVRAWLYKHRPLAATATPLMMGRVGERKPHEPVAWTNTTRWGGRVFYTMMGHPEDFQLAAFEQLLRNAVYWAAGLSAPEEE